MSLVPVLLALFPVTVLIALGLGLRRLPGFGSDEFWAGAEKLAYYCLLPVLLFTSVAEVDVAHVPIARLAAALVIPTVIVSVGIVLARRVVARDLPAFTSVLQGGIRFNTYVGLSLAGSLFGAEGTAVAAIVAAILVPTVNIISSLGFEFLRTGPSSLVALLRAIVTNPLVLGCVVGAVANVSGLGLPAVAATVLDPLAAASLPIGLLCVGAGLRMVEMRDHARAIITSTVIKLLVLPGLSLAALAQFAVPSVPALVGMVFQSIATASSGYVMARQLGGDAKLMAALIAGQTVIMLLTLPFVLLIAQSVLA
ncbi:AEC family transporter [Brevibacterium spongiae]|uniref:AEC family transporter n=1 Tax=Brevibacterium spongiae TaxID=2909672 RepID=A0ABY5STD7_9MICO|nr:AEC family transporter [Brevibacterium spongiae]UVI37817.1 AEC family transporter [Brevibacterium spongiae]